MWKIKCVLYQECQAFWRLSQSLSNWLSLANSVAQIWAFRLHGPQVRRDEFVARAQTETGLLN